MLSGGAEHKNFGYPEDTTEEMAVKGYNWVLTMRITHLVSASLMVPVVFFGWQIVGESTRVLFIIGTLSEVAFGVYDWLKTFLLTFCHSAFKKWGPPSL